MNHALEAGTHVGGDERIFTRLVSRTDLPTRLRPLLEGILSLCSSGLGHIVTATLDDVEPQLFNLAQYNGGHVGCFESLNEIKRGRADMVSRYMLAIEESLACFDQQFGTKPDATVVGPRPGALPRHELSLVDNGALEESLALQEFVAKIESRQAHALYELGHRFGVLAGAPALDAATVPIGPARLGVALLRACICLDIVPEHRVVLYHSFDRVATPVVGEFYTKVNGYLIAHGILRYLRPLAPHAKSRASEAPVATTPAARPSARETEPQSALGMPFEPVQPRADKIIAPVMPIAARVHAVPANEHDSQLFATLRDLLAGSHNALGASHPATGGYIPSGAEVQAALGSLQAKPIPPNRIGGKVVQRSVGHLKQDLMDHLRQLAPDGQTPQLAAEDADTIDLVGMLFDYIMKNLRAEGSTLALTTKLQVPLLRVALHDKSFFTRQTHPARHLLNTIAETGSRWIDNGEGQADRALADKMQIVVDRMTREFDGNLDVIEDPLSDLSQHIHMLARKAEFAERRHVDAAKGREKLAVARERANNEVVARIAAARPGKLVRTLLEQAWTDVLVLTLLREGENSEVYRKRLEVADRLLTIGKVRDSNFKLPNALREEIEAGLDKIGYHKDDIDALIRRLEMRGQADPGGNSTAGEFVAKFKSMARLGDYNSGERPTAKADSKKKSFAPNSAEARMYERLKGLSFGTWFEFRSNQQGDTVRRKLAWFSTLTGRCLFVNQRGARADERTLVQLARDLVKGQVSIIEPEQGTLVDRAWKAVVASLKHFVGRDPAQPNQRGSFPGSAEVAAAV